MQEKRIEKGIKSILANNQRDTIGRLIMTKVNVQKALELFIDELTEDQCESLTFEDLTEFCKEFIRVAAYQEFPATDSKTLEALLLLYTNITSLNYEKLGISMSQTVLSIEGIEYNLEAVKTMTEFTEQMGKCLRKTLQQLAST